MRARGARAEQRDGDHATGKRHRPARHLALPRLHHDATDLHPQPIAAGMVDEGVAAHPPEHEQGAQQRVPAGQDEPTAADGEAVTVPGVCVLAHGPDAGPAFIIPVEVQVDDGCLHRLSAVTTLGTPQDNTLQDRRIIAFFPADEAADRRWRVLLGRDDPAA